MIRALRVFSAFEREHPIMLTAFGVGVSSLTYWSFKIFGAGDKATAVATALAAAYSIGVPSMMYLYERIRDRPRQMQRDQFLDQLDPLYGQLMQIKCDLINLLDLLLDQLQPCPETILVQGNQLLARQDQLLNQLCLCRVRGQLIQDQGDQLLAQRDQLINRLGRVLEQLIQDQGDLIGQVLAQLTQDQEDQPIDQLIDHLEQVRAQLIQQQGDLLGQPGQLVQLGQLGLGQLQAQVAVQTQNPDPEPVEHIIQDRDL